MNHFHKNKSTKTSYIYSLTCLIMLLLLTSFSNVYARQTGKPDSIVVKAPAGKFRGKLTSAGDQIFAGIPFALPPVGKLRLLPPQPVADIDTVYDAGNFRSAPVQKGAVSLSSSQNDTKNPGSNAIGSTLAGMNSLKTSEDCLYLNVWVPKTKNKKLPVVIWLYGGGFEIGSGSPPQTDGAALANATDAIVVAFNYRVGALGWGYWSGVGGKTWEKSSNLGLQDQAAAIQWVYRNISSFGGDTKNITIAGESAGAFSVGTLLTLPQIKGKFNKAILNSGSSGRFFSTETANAMAQKFMQIVGVTTMEELQTVPVDKILEAQAEVIDGDIGVRNLPGGKSWGIVLDGVVVPQDPQVSLKKGLAKHIPLLISANRDEIDLFRVMNAASFAPKNQNDLIEEMKKVGIKNPPALIDAYRKHLIELNQSGDDLGHIRALFLTDAVYRRPSVQMAAIQNITGGKAWTYLFSGTPLGKQLGSFHGADLMYTFDGLKQMQANTPENLAIQKDMIRTWGQFLHHGKVDWPKYDPNKVYNVRQFGGSSSFVTEPSKEISKEIWPFNY